MSVVRRVTVRVPATTSNLGPGFDCLGMALDLYNEVTLELHAEKGPTLVEISGEGETALPRDEKNMVARAAKMVLGKNRDLGRLVFKCVNCIPTGRGLGSSAAAILSGLYAANYLFDPPLESAERLEELAVELEGHPDNVAPAARGGMILSLRDGERLMAFPIRPHRKIGVVVCAPDFELATEKSRAALPVKVARADAVFNAARAMLLVSAIEKGRLDLLALAMEDRVHQPYRAPLVKGMEEVIAAAVGAGSCGAALSGAGPSIVALCSAGLRAVLVGRRMQEAFAKRGVESRALVLNPVRKGIEVIA